MFGAWERECYQAQVLGMQAHQGPPHSLQSGQATKAPLLFLDEISELPL